MSTFGKRECSPLQGPESKRLCSETLGGEAAAAAEGQLTRASIPIMTPQRVEALKCKYQKRGWMWDGGERLFMYLLADSGKRARTGQDGTFMLAARVGSTASDAPASRLGHNGEHVIS